MTVSSTEISVLTVAPAHSSVPKGYSMQDSDP